MKVFPEEKVSKKIIKSVKNFLIRAFASSLFDKNSEYCNKAKKMFGFRYVVIVKLKMIKRKILNMVPKSFKHIIKKLLKK